MHSGSVQAVEMVFLLLLLFVVAFGVLARKLQTPYPIILVIAGALLGFVPGIPNIPLNPDLIFFVILPPLLYAAAWGTSWRGIFFSPGNNLILALLLRCFPVARSFLPGHPPFPAVRRPLRILLGCV